MLDLKSQILQVDDWPKPGIIHYSVDPLFSNPDYFRELIEQLARPYLEDKVDFIAGIEARGLLMASALAYRLGIGAIMIRKNGKLPEPAITQEYDYEYASDCIAINPSVINPGQKVVLVDDILATGGTMLAARELMNKLQANIVGFSCIIEIQNKGGRERLWQEGERVYSLVVYD